MTSEQKVKLHYPDAVWLSDRIWNPDPINGPQPLSSQFSDQERAWRDAYLRLKRRNCD